MSGVAKVLNKLKQSVQDGNYYEAHQMYHSVSQRLLKQKKISQALELIQDGVKNMILNNQSSSAIDLFIKLLEICELESNASEDVKDRILILFCLMPLNNSFTDEFIRISLKFSFKFTNMSCELHHAFGIRYLSQGFFYDAEYHLSQGTLDSANLLGLMDWEWSTLHKNVDSGYFLVRSVLMYLLLGKFDYAKNDIGSFLKQYGSASPSENVISIPHSCIEILFTNSGLVNFAQILVACLQSGTREQYRHLISVYQKELQSVDGSLLEALNSYIYDRFYNTEKKQTNPLESLMKSLFSSSGDSSRANTEQKMLELSQFDMD